MQMQQNILEMEGFRGDFGGLSLLLFFMNQPMVYAHKGILALKRPWMSYNFHPGSVF